MIGKPRSETHPSTFSIKKVDSEPLVDREDLFSLTQSRVNHLGAQDLDLFLHVEISDREFQAKLLLATLGASRGHNVLVCDWATMIRAVAFGRRKRGFVLTKSLTPSESKLRNHALILALGIEIASIDEESNITMESYVDFALSRYSVETLSQASIVFCWGEDDYDTLTATYPAHSKRFHKTGSPRVDLWDSRFNSPTLTSGVKTRRPFALVISSIGGAVSKVPFHEVVKTYRKLGYFSRDPNYYRWLLDQERETHDLLAAYVELLHQWSRIPKSYDIVLRPRPDEDVEAWENILGQLESVSIAPDGPVAPLLRQSAAVVQTGSTVAYEALFMGKPVFSFSPFPLEFRSGEFANDLGVRVATAEEIHQGIESRVREQPAGTFNLWEDREQHVRKKIYFSEDQLASDRMLDVLEEAFRIRPSNEMPRLATLRNPGMVALILYSTVPRWMQTLYRKLKSSTKDERNWKFPDVNRSETVRLIRHFESVMKITNPSRVRFVGRRGVWIMPSTRRKGR